MFCSSGKIVVHPKDRDTWPQPLWVVLHVESDDLGRYYLEQSRIAVRAWYQLQQPVWKTHISIVRGEIEAKPDDEYPFDGEEVGFLYENFVYQAGGHFCVGVECEASDRIRSFLGLAPALPVPLHMTVGVIVQPSHHYDFWTIGAGEAVSE